MPISYRKRDDGKWEYRITFKDPITKNKRSVQNEGLELNQKRDM